MSYDSHENMERIRSLGLITSQKAAKHLGCSVQHVRLLIKSGRIQGEKIGRDWFVGEETVKEYAKHRYEAPPRPQPSVAREPQVESLFADEELQSVVNVASVPQRSPFRYPGGKTWLIPIARLWLGSLRPIPDLLVEPFAGGGGIGLMAAIEKFTRKTLLVELDPEIASVWKTMLAEPCSQLVDRVLGFEMNEASVREVLASEPSDLSDRAFQTILRNRVSRGGILAPGAGLIKSGEAGRGLASRWYPETLAKRMQTIYEHRASISFRESDGMEVMCEHRNDPHASFFIDPPYPVAGKRLYRFHDLDHRSLFETMSLLTGPFLATYDHNPFIESLAHEFKFETRLVPMKSTHHARKMELLVSRSFEWLPVGSGGEL